MKIISTQLKATARDHLAGRYAVLILSCVAADVIINIPYMTISSTVSPYTNTGSLILIATIVILSALSAIFTVGQNYICLCYAKSPDRVPSSYIWYGFKGRADDIIKAYFMIFVRFALSLLPAVFALALCLTMPNAFTALLSLALFILSAALCIRIELDYSQVFFLLIERPELSAKETLSAGKQMIRGSRGRLLYLQISFIGMYLLNLLTFNVARFWITPYVRMTMTEFYLNLNKAPAQTTEA